MRPRFLLSFAIAVLVAANAETIHAQNGESEPATIFKSLDANSDGTLTASEVGQEREKFFNRLVRIGDTNKDGKLTREEFLQAVNRKAPAVRTGASRTGRFGGRTRSSDYRATFNRLDRNRNGKLSLAEIPQFSRPRFKLLFDGLQKTEITLDEYAKFSRFGGNRPGNPQDSQARAEALFNRIDTNNDGKVTLKETPQAMRRFIVPIFRRAGKSDDGEMTKAEFLKAVNSGRTKFGGQNAARAILRQFDKNRDGVISKEEANGPIKQNFDRIDANKNGKLEASELARIRGNDRPQRKRPKQ